MATWYLINNIRVGTVARYAGTLIDDAQNDTTPILAAGGLLYPSATPGLATASAIAESFVRAGNSPMAESVMLAALDAVQSGQITTNAAQIAAQDTVGNTVATNLRTASATYLDLGVPAARADNAVHAAYNADQPVAFPGPITNPDVPRNLTVTFAALWDGGDVVVDGEIDGIAVTETFVANPGATVVGTVMFDTVTAIEKTLVGAAAAAAEVGVGDVLCLHDNGTPVTLANNAALLLVDLVPEAGTVDVAESSIAPTTVPDGIVNFTALVNATHTHTQVAHNHTLS